MKYIYINFIYNIIYNITIIPVITKITFFSTRFTLISKNILCIVKIRKDISNEPLCVRIFYYMAPFHPYIPKLPSFDSVQLISLNSRLPRG